MVPPGTAATPVQLSQAPAVQREAAEAVPPDTVAASAPHSHGGESVDEPRVDAAPAKAPAIQREATEATPPGAATAPARHSPGVEAEKEPQGDAAPAEAPAGSAPATQPGTVPPATGPPAAAADEAPLLRRIEQGRESISRFVLGMHAHMSGGVARPIPKPAARRTAGPGSAVPVPDHAPAGGAPEVVVGDTIVISDDDDVAEDAQAEPARDHATPPTVLAPTLPRDHRRHAAEQQGAAGKDAGAPPAPAGKDADAPPAPATPPPLVEIDAVAFEAEREACRERAAAAENRSLRGWAAPRLADAYTVSLVRERVPRKPSEYPEDDDPEDKGLPILLCMITVAGHDDAIPRDDPRYKAPALGRLLSLLAGGLNGRQIDICGIERRRMPFWNMTHTLPFEGQFSNTVNNAVHAGHPKPRLIEMRPDSWVKGANDEARAAPFATYGWMVNAVGLGLFTHYPERILRARGAYFVGEATSTDMLASALPLPTRTPPFTSRRPSPPTLSDAFPAAQVMDNACRWVQGRRWEDLFAQNAVGRQAVQAILRFCDDGRRDFEQALRAAESTGSFHTHRRRQSAGHQGGELRIPFHAYDHTTQDLLRRGLYFEIDEDGLATLRGERPMLGPEEFSFNRDAFTEFFDAMQRSGHGSVGPGGWPDQGIRQVLERGADDDADLMPPLCILSANHQGALDNPATFAQSVTKEVDKGFMGRPQKAPPFIPFSCIPANLVPKLVGEDGEVLTWRKVHDATWPRLFTYLSCVGGIPLAPNEHSRRGSENVFEWCNGATLAACAEVYARILEGSDFRVVARVTDKDGWFRQIPTAHVDRRKAVTMLAGDFVRDDRLIMGKRAASQQGDRITQLSVAYLEARFDATITGIWPLLPKKLRLLLQDWSEARAQIFGPMPEQRRPVVFRALQDDITTIVAGRELASYVQKILDTALSEELGVALSTKPAATLPFDLECETIGVRLVMNGPDRHMEPRLVVQDKFRKLAKVITEIPPGESKQLSKAWVESFVGLYGHILKFLRNAGSLRNSASMLKRGQPGVPVEKRVIKGDGLFATDVRTVVERLMSLDFIPLVRSPRAIHGGRLSCAADACMAEGGTTGGFGFIVGNKYAQGLWPDPIRAAFAKKLISISPLEYAVELFAHRIWARELMAQEPQRSAMDKLAGGWTISRSDNLAACMVSTRQLSTRPLMAYFIRRQAAIEEELGVSIAFDHIPGVDNSIPDKLSRGRVDEALAEMRALGIQPQAIVLGAEWRAWMDDLVEIIGTLRHPDGDWDVADAVIDELDQVPDIAEEVGLGVGVER